MRIVKGHRYKVVSRLLLGFALGLFTVSTFLPIPQVSARESGGCSVTTNATSPYTQTSGMCVGSDGKYNYYQFAVAFKVDVSNASVSAKAGGTTINFVKENKRLYVSTPDTSTGAGYRTDTIPTNTSCNTQNTAQHNVTITASANGKTQDIEINLCDAEYRQPNQTIVRVEASQIATGDNGSTPATSTGTIEGTIGFKRDGAPSGSALEYGAMQKDAIISIKLENTKTHKVSEWNNSASNSIYSVTTAGQLDIYNVASPGPYKVTIHYNDRRALLNQDPNAQAEWANSDITLTYNNITVPANGIAYLNGANNEIQYYNGSGQAAEGPTDSSTTEQFKDNCPLDPDAPMRWLGCGVFAGLHGAAEKLTEQLDAYLYTDPSIFDAQTQKAATVFRNIAMALVLIAGLIMVISQALGFDFLDAYTIRKLLPKLGIALIGMALAWPLLKLAVSLTNDLGGMIYSVFLDIAGESEATGGAVGVGGGITAMLGIFVGTAAVAGYAAVVGALAFLSLLGAIVLALLIGLLVLSIRQLVIFMAIIMAPIAIAAYVIPGGEKLWKFWKTTLITTLLMYPLIMGFIGAGAAMSYLLGADQENGRMSVLAIVVYFAPFFMLPFAFKLAGGLMTTIFSLTNDKSKGMFDRMSKYRSNSGKRRWGKLADGTLGGRLTQKTLGTAARMSAIPDQNYLTPTGRRRFSEHSRKLLQDSARKRAEDDRGFSLGTTDATEAAIHASSREDFLKKYVENNRNTKSFKGMTDSQIEAKGRQRMLQLEAGTGAQMGSDLMQATAFRGRTALDNAGWFNDDGTTDHAGMARAINHLVGNGVLSTEDIADIIGQNKMRGDMSARSFGKRLGFADLAVKRGGVLTDDDIRQANAESYNAMRNSDAELGNLRVAERVSKEGIGRLKASLTGNADAAGVTGLTGSSKVDTLASEFATLANFQDMAASASIDSREKFAEVMKQEISINEIDRDLLPKIQPLFEALGREKVSYQQVKDWIQGNIIISSIDDRGNPISRVVAADHEIADLFTARRKEYGSARARDAAAAGGMVDPVALGGRGPSI